VKKPEPNDICEGCRTGNPFLCKSFPGVAPAHATDHAAWQKRRAKERQRQLDLERAEAKVFRREDDVSGVFS
jgi:hypothetical protein